jgi:phosphoenolpyruvate carboxykinase (GTP)
MPPSCRGSSTNWFRRDADGGFLWPGFGENIRVLKWAVARLEDAVAAVDTPIGRIPAPGTLDVTGLALTDDQLAAAVAVDLDEWRAELPAIQAWLDHIGDAVPTTLRDELDALRQRLG